MKFIEPSVPILKPVPPAGEGWLHEVKLDGYRLQMHKSGNDVVLFSRRGHDVTNRFEVIARAVARLSVRVAIFDGELTALNDDGLPDFYGLHLRRSENLCVWIFDILLVNGTDLRDVPLFRRRVQLERVLRKREIDGVRLSETFDDPLRLLEICNEKRLEGIVSKKVDAPYRSGRTTSWIKVKSQSWRSDNQERFEHFQRHK